VVNGNSELQIVSFSRTRTAAQLWDPKTAKRALSIRHWCCCDAERKARRYCARCNSTAVAAAAADGVAMTQWTD